MEQPVIPVDVLRRLSALSARINSGQQLAATLQAVAEAVVDALGFGIAVVNYRHPDGSFETVAVAGSDEARASLIGRRQPEDAFDAEFEVAEPWGRLRFVPHDRLPAEALEGWVPDAPVRDLPDAWHPLDALYAPLTSAGGEVVGMLAVDLPHDGRLPGPLQRELLETFASQAGIAIDHARLTHQLRLEQEELRQEKSRLQTSETAFRLAFTGSASGMVTVSLDTGSVGRITRANDAACRIIGYRSDQLIGRAVTDFIDPDDIEASREATRRAANGNMDAYRAERRFRRPDGSTVWLSLTNTVVDADGDADRFILVQIDDITARRAEQRTLEHHATHDPLTGLPNRRLLTQRLDAALTRSRRTGRRGAVLFCDLDGFKELNDRYGHVAGDQALRVIGERLLAEVRSRDTVARLGGDEFVVLCEDIDTDTLASIVTRLAFSVAQPLPDTGIRMGISIGTATFDAASCDLDQLLRRADEAMYEAKARRASQ